MCKFALAEQIRTCGGDLRSQPSFHWVTVMGNPSSRQQSTNHSKFFKILACVPPFP